MGASQSSNSTSTPSSSTEIKTSYYTLLGVERQAPEDEIKKAYRRKALELHPDRNFGNVEATTRLFAEVQSAYQVLSDPQERAWYDSHESAILRGDDPTDDVSGGGSGGGVHYEANVRFTSADDIARMVRKFNSNVVFSDAPSGFFGFLRETFETLAKEEDIAAYNEGDQAQDYPSFGHKDDGHEDVVKTFYAMWSSFATRKSFAWKDMYRLSEAPDRRIRRLMEKENQRLREEGVREYNDAVRSFVAFVRKRDPRYVPSTQSEAERQKVLRDATAAQAARARAANAAAKEQVIPDWAQVAQKDEHEGEIEESSSEEEQFECVACRKTFKSEKQYDAHEKSNKHKKALQALRKKMAKDARHLNLEDDGEVGSGVTTPATDDAEEETQEADLEEHKDIGNGVKAEDGELEDMKALEIEEHNNELEESEQEQHDETLTTSKANGTKTNHDTTKHDSSDSDPSSNSDSDYASLNQIQSCLDPSAQPKSDTFTPDDGDDSDCDQTSSTKQPKQQKGKAALKRAKKAAAAAAAAQTTGDPDEEDKFKCATCNAGFPSKTRMHQHIKDFGHAALKESGGSSGGKKGKKKR